MHLYENDINGDLTSIFCNPARGLELAVDCAEVDCDCSADPPPELLSPEDPPLRVREGPFLVLLDFLKKPNFIVNNLCVLKR